MVHNILVLENIYTCLSYFDPASPLDMTKAEDVLEAMHRSPANNWVIGGVTDMSNYDIKIVRLSVENGGGYATIVPALSGCMSDGETAQEALANVFIAIDDWIEEAQRLNRPIPEPDIPLQGYAFG